MKIHGRNYLASTLLLFSMESYYFYQVGVAPIPFVMLCISLALFASSPSREIDRKTWAFLSFAPLVLMISGLLSLAGVPQNLKALGGICFSVLASLAAVRFQDRVEISNGLMIYLKVHSLLLYIQAIFLLFGMHLDFLVWATGESQRVGTATFEILGRQVMRPSGLFNEPGTFSAFYLAPLALWILLSERIKRLEWLLILTPLLTLSLQAVLTWSLCVPLLLLKKGYFRKNWAGLLVAIAGASIVVVFWDYLYFSAVQKISIDEIKGNQLRLLFVYEEILLKINDLWILGNGLPIDVGYSPSGESWLVNDQGLLIWATWSLGLPVTAFLLFLISRSISEAYYFAPFFVFLSSKYSLTYPFPLFFLALLIYSSKFKLHSTGFVITRSMQI